MSSFSEPLDGGTVSSVLELHARSVYERSLALVEQGDYTAALTLLDQAMTSNAFDHLAWTLRGMVLVCLGDYEEAIASCDRALALRPNHAEAWKFRGIALHGLNRYREAYASYDRALGIVRLSPMQRFLQWFRQTVNPDATALSHSLFDCAYPTPLCEEQ